jgi:tetratricopeptide (TPR) repeat protein
MELLMEENSQEELIIQGLAALEVAEFDEAIELFGRVAVESPDDAQAWFYLGLCYLETGNPDLAAEALNRAVAAQPDHADAHYLLGTTVGALGRFEDAVTSYRRSLEIDPDHYKAEEFLIRTEALLESREHYRRAVRLIYAEVREPKWLDYAVRELLQSVAIFNESPARAEFPKLASDVVSSTNRTSVVPDLLQDGPFWSSSVRRAQEAFAKKRWTEAASHYHEALDLSPDHAFIHHSLGLIYFQLGDVEGGIRAWQRALDLDSNWDFSSMSFLEVDR